MVAQIESWKPNFINLNNIAFAKHVFIYKVNDAYSINDLSKFSTKHQLLFQKLESKIQQLNLMFVDSTFINILADVTLHTFLNNGGSFIQYSNSKNKIKLVDGKDEDRYLKYKFMNFIHMLLYTNVASKNIFNGTDFYNRIYYLKNKIGEIDYFSIYDQSVLQQKLFDELKLNIDTSLSSISNRAVKLCLKIHF